MSNTISLLIVARVRLYRDGLAEALAHHPQVEVVGTAADAQTALRLVHALRPTVAVIDLNMSDGVRFAKGCAEALPHVSVLALTATDRDEDLLAVAEAGISGYVTYDSSLDELVGAAQSVARGEMLCSPRVAAALFRQVGSLARRVRPDRDEARLTARELEILELIDAGRSNKEIARELYIEVPTVKNHVHNILEKLSVARRAEAAAKVRTHGLLPTRADPIP